MDIQKKKKPSLLDKMTGVELFAQLAECLANTDTFDNTFQQEIPNIGLCENCETLLIHFDISRFSIGRNFNNKILIPWVLENSKGGQDQ